MQPSRGKLSESEISYVVVFRNRGSKLSLKFSKTSGAPQTPVGIVAPLVIRTVLSNLSAIHLDPPDLKIDIRLVSSDPAAEKGGSALF